MCWCGGQGCSHRAQPVGAHRSDLPKTCSVELEYKYIVIDGKGRALEWQPGSNMRLAVPEGSNALLEVVDSWTGAAHEVQLGGDAGEAARQAFGGSRRE